MRIPKKSHAGVLMKMEGNQYLGGGLIGRDPNRRLAGTPKKW